MKFEGRNIFSMDFTSQNNLLAWADNLVENGEYNVKIFSRLPPRRLLEHIDISKISLFWLTERNSEFSLPPNLDMMRHHILTSISDDDALIIIDGFEWLTEIHGMDVMLNFVNDVSDLLYGTRVRIIFPFDELSFDSIWLSRVRKIISHLDIENVVTEPKSFDMPETIDEIIQSPSERIEYELGVDGSQRLSILSRLPKIGFTHGILVKRILQWRRMGLDVSELEPALSYEMEESYALYTLVEEKIRRVVDLENYLYHNLENMGASELSTALFRMKQLTGIDELERKYYTNNEV